MMHSFVKKRVHFSEKTTCCFYENDGLFLVKRRVVFLVLFERRGFLVFLGVLVFLGILDFLGVLVFLAQSR